MTTPSQFVKQVKDEFVLEHSDEDENNSKRASQNTSQTLHVSQHSPILFDSDEDFEDIDALSQQIKEIKKQNSQKDSEKEIPSCAGTTPSVGTPLELDEDSEDWDEIDALSQQIKLEKQKKQESCPKPLPPPFPEEKELELSQEIDIPEDDEMLDSQTERMLQELEGKSLQPTNPQEKTQEKEKTKHQEVEEEEDEMTSEEENELDIAEKLLLLSQEMKKLNAVVPPIPEPKVKVEKKTLNSGEKLFEIDLDDIMLTEDQELKLMTQMTQITPKEEKIQPVTEILPTSEKNTPSSSTSKIQTQKKRKRENHKNTKFKKLKFDPSVKLENVQKSTEPTERNEEEIIQFEATPPNKESQISEFSSTPPPATQSALLPQDRRSLLFNFFGSQIYQRGYHYFDEGRTFEMELKTINKDTFELKGKCYGTQNEPYHPQVAFRENAILKSTCNCPFVNNCKHGCALLLSYYDSIDQEMPLKDNLKSKYYVSQRRIETLQKEYNELHKEYEKLNDIVNRQKNEGKKKIEIKLRNVVKMNLDKWPFYVQFEE
jgi:hypothetical protein